MNKESKHVPASDVAVGYTAIVEHRLAGAKFYSESEIQGIKAAAWAEGWNDGASWPQRDENPYEPSPQRCGAIVNDPLEGDGNDAH